MVETAEIVVVKNYLLDLQQQMCHQLAEEDGKESFQPDRWEYKTGSGGGITSVLANGAVIERGGVNFSHIQGDSLPPSGNDQFQKLEGYGFEAMGVSSVIHPLNPYVPTAHMNVRFFCATKPNTDPIWWFGGGFDLTPYYPFQEDCIHFHQMAKQACDPFGEEVYPRLKRWADEYFYLKHRQEHRGIGGLFFDNLHEWSFEQCFAFTRSVGDHFLKAYCPIIDKRKNTPFGERERWFQRYRRGRYVEFNLLIDRGTLFGIQSNGRTESILMSMPPEVNWTYNWQPELGSPEAKLTQFLQPQEWIETVSS